MSNHSNWLRNCPSRYRKGMDEAADALDAAEKALLFIKKHQETIMKGSYEMSSTWQIADAALKEI